MRLKNSANECSVNGQYKLLNISAQSYIPSEDDVKIDLLQNCLLV